MSHLYSRGGSCGNEPVCLLLWSFRGQYYPIKGSATELRHVSGASALHLLEENDVELRRPYRTGRKDSEMYIRGETVMVEL